eukprot:TRINITY_DN9060_c0_g3_i1.p1 TRINITY_DN9060_c0_g3~~TRINITY_DN9060_c0_g3_i1.p1  ORF type:complete len:525 (+),score=108.65 TRINITY_DN9060_c0_g3_i1:1088-2662(+)
MGVESDCVNAKELIQQVEENRRPTERRMWNRLSGLVQVLLSTLNHDRIPIMSLYRYKVTFAGVDEEDEEEEEVKQPTKSKNNKKAKAKKAKGKKGKGKNKGGNKAAASSSSSSSSGSAAPNVASKLQAHTRIDKVLSVGKGKVKKFRLSDWSSGLQQVQLVSLPSAEASLTAPRLAYHQASETLSQVTWDLDVLCVFPSSASLSTLLHTLRASISCQLDQARSVAAAAADASCVKAFHFAPYQYLAHPITTVYRVPLHQPHLISFDEAWLLEQRQQLHAAWHLPLDRPLLRISNSIDVDLYPHMGVDGILIDLHLSEEFEQLQRVSGVNNGRRYFVQPSYAYFHYQQHNFNDKGWGCAYRSLQTLCSWLYLQRYTNQPIPSHHAIQACLVANDDKPAHFEGSSEWIGAIELSVVLHHLFGVTCKILSMSSGADMASKGRELARHFTTQGTPIMIGGGSYAHTMLGIDFNEETGDIRFLILDPHYVGSEDARTIISKGWCAWKSVDFFNKNAFYNLCMPQRPQVI